MQLRDTGYWIGESFRNPRDAARRFLNQDWPNGVEWIGLGIVSVLSVLLLALGGSAVGNAIVVPIEVPQILLVGLVAAILYGLALMVYALGGFFGAQTPFRQVFILLLWLSFLRLAVDAFIVLLAVLMPGLFSALISLILSIWVLWLFVVWMDTAWGWSNLLKSGGILVLSLFLTIVAASFAISFGLVLTGQTLPAQG